jgi:hypothetical protein
MNDITEEKKKDRKKKLPTYTEIFKSITALRALMATGRRPKRPKPLLNIFFGKIVWTVFVEAP